MSWRIKKYNKYCSKINDKIRELTSKARDREMLKYVTTKRRGYHPVLTEEYEDLTQERLNEVLQGYNLMDDIREIEELSRGLPNRSNKLLRKLEKLKDKWENRFNIV